MGESRIRDSFDGLSKSRGFQSLLQRQGSRSQRGGTGQRKRLHPGRYFHFHPIRVGSDLEIHLLNVEVLLCVCVQKWERERLEKQKQQAEKTKADKGKDAAADKVQDTLLFFLSLLRIRILLFVGIN